MPGFPTFVLVDGDGQEFDRWIGFSDVEGWLATFKTAKDDPSAVAEKIRRFDEGPSAALGATLARIFRARGEHREAVHYWREARDLAGGGYGLEIFEGVRSGMKNESFSLDEVLAAADAARAEANGDPSALLAIAFGVGASAVAADRPEEMVPYLGPALAASEGIEDGEIAADRHRIEILDALHVARDEERAVRLKRESMPEGWLEDAGELNAFAWWCFQNEVALEEAETLARKGVEIVEPGTRKAAILDTVAEIRNLRGDPEEAVALMEAAVAEDPDNEYWSGQLARFRALLSERGF